MMRVDGVLHVLVLLVLGLFAATAGVQQLGGCVHGGGTKAARIQSAVTALAEVLDPSFELAMVACAAREEALERPELERERKGLQTATETEAKLVTIRERCDDLRAAFLGMRTGLAMAEQALDAGTVEAAETRLEEVQSTWTQLKPGPGPP